MRQQHDLAGQRFGKWLVMSQVDPHSHGHKRWLCMCDCGARKVVLGYALRQGRSTKCRRCACCQPRLHKEDLIEKHPLYRTYWAMKDRCRSSNIRTYKNYGGRGIKVCGRWCGPRGFDNFVADMGPRPSGLQIDRKNNNGNYTPENCRWVTSKQNTHNRRLTIWVTFQGQRKPLAEWCEDLELNYDVVQMRLNKLGWPVERAFATPVRKYKSTASKSASAE